VQIVALQVVECRVVELIQVDVIGAQPPKRSVHRVREMRSRKVLARATFRIPHDARLRRDDHVLPLSRQDDA
jgi:hypothetical protein